MFTISSKPRVSTVFRRTMRLAAATAMIMDKPPIANQRMSPFDITSSDASVPIVGGRTVRASLCRSVGRYGALGSRISAALRHSAPPTPSSSARRTATLLASTAHVAPDRDPRRAGESSLSVTGRAGGADIAHQDDPTEAAIELVTQAQVPGDVSRPAPDREHSAVHLLSVHVDAEAYDEVLDGMVLSLRAYLSELRDTVPKPLERNELLARLVTREDEEDLSAEDRWIQSAVSNLLIALDPPEEQ